MVDILQTLRCLQLDPIRAVERTQFLVLWSRLGAYERAWLHELAFTDKTLFEYWAHQASIVLTEDYPIHNHFMRHYGTNPKKKVTKWIAQNQGFKAYVLGEIDRRGPLLTKELEDRPDVPVTSSGWTNGRSLPYMLDYLWMKGEIMVADRDGLKRWWDLGERVLPEKDVRPHAKLDDDAVTERSAELALHSLGIARAKDINKHFVEKRYYRLNAALDRLVSSGLIQKALIPAWGDETWYIHQSHLPQLDRLQAGEGFHPRLTLLSPFDHLIRDRDRTELMWDFYYRIEIYVPKAKRIYGYYVLPILDGEHLIGRIDSRMDRKTGVYHIQAIYTEPNATFTAENGRALQDTLNNLGQFIGAKEIRFEHDRGRLPAVWQACIG